MMLEVCLVMSSIISEVFLLDFSQGNLGNFISNKLSNEFLAIMTAVPTTPKAIAISFSKSPNFTNFLKKLLRLFIRLL